MDNIKKNYNDTYKNKDKLVHFIVAEKEKEDDEMKTAFEKLICCLKKYLFIEKDKSKYSTYIGYLDNVLKNTIKTCEDEIAKKEMEIKKNNNSKIDIKTKFHKNRANVNKMVKLLIKEIRNHYEKEHNDIKNVEEEEEESKNKSKSKSKNETKQNRTKRSIFSGLTITDMKTDLIKNSKKAYSIIKKGKHHNEKTIDEELNNFIKFFEYKKSKSETNIYNKILEIINEKKEINKIITDRMIINYLSINEFYIISDFITNMMIDVKNKLDDRKKDYYKLKFENFCNNDLLNLINQDPLNNEENILSQKYRDDVLNKIGSSMNDELNKYLKEIKKDLNDWLLKKTITKLEDKNFSKLVENLTTIKTLKSIKDEQKIQDEDNEEEKSNLVDKEFIQVEENFFKKFISYIVNYVVVNFIFPGNLLIHFITFFFFLINNFSF